MDNSVCVCVCEREKDITEKSWDLYKMVTH